MRVVVIIPTFEPNYRRGDKNTALLNFYETNFKSWLCKENSPSNVDLRLIISDHKSSNDFRDFLRNFADKNSRVSILEGDSTETSVVAFNIGLKHIVDADFYVYAASDTAAYDGSWINLMVDEFEMNASASIIFSTCSVGGSDLCDQTQIKPLDRKARTLQIWDQPNPNVVFFRHTIIAKFGYKIGDKIHNDLGVSLTWMSRAIGMDRILSYRLFVHHDHFTEKGRYERVLLSSVASEDSQTARYISRYLHIPRPRLPYPWPKFSPGRICENMKRPIRVETKVPKTIFYLLRFVRLLYSQFIKASGLHYFFSQVNYYGFYNIFFQKRSFEKKLFIFDAKTEEERIDLVKHLFFQDL